jgi:prevent-host-death family protein
MQSETVDIAEAQAHLKDLVHRVSGGIEVILSENEKPVARILPVRKRIAGLDAGSTRTSDDFDAELPDAFWIAKERPQR